ncbi:ABC transporter substrate-binding protein [Echinicola sp. CAU 1574]|uniref:ABC transporter substrate-binding protein n=1 Tax=Echinicola arenosa TaxID=2774144 RepID=A0ABR9AQZ2_9BACT|nr:ABC transporter substrate-binding protein [Echinicola arenosa]MBD8491206.1 ABC transporter substrate-binding protein [Echinicola arenosa]
MRKVLFYLTIIFSIAACSAPNQKASLTEELKEIPVDHAVGFKIIQGKGYKIVEVLHGFPGEHQTFRYLVKETGKAEVPESHFDAIIDSSVQKIILTSTTQIPHLDELGLSKNLIAFPNTKLISSKRIRKQIDQGDIEDLGTGAKYNIEKIIDMEPDLVVISTLGDNLKDLQLLDQANIPTVINGDYMEQHPLGRAEWIKFTGALTGKLQEATKKFDEVKQNYNALKSSVKKANLENLPTVISGNMYKDIWYAPAGNNWGAIFLKDAGADYIFKDQESLGSLQLNYEYVLEKGLNANTWISTAEFTSLDQMKNADERYTQFSSFQQGEVYTFSNTRGETGGLEYFELGYTRPDIILKDLIKIFHPGLLPNYRPYFYQKLD